MYIYIYICVCMSYPVQSIDFESLIFEVLFVFFSIGCMNSCWLWPAGVDRTGACGPFGLEIRWPKAGLVCTRELILFRV